uniref:Uncharacterized protein n=1 Tax=uncultured prokaryote TaxID=198431 RepID=A0A0H5Q9W4_9ZZZZ|nr:hypothetical protein [uncultured prokaryote]
MPYNANDYSVQVTLAGDTLTPRDVTVGTWAIKAATGEAEFVDALSAFATFYLSMAGYLANSVSAAPNVHEISMYHLSEPEPRIPVLTVPFSLGPGGEGLPNEVALCTSFAAASESGVPAGRRRGRVYFGPIDAAFMDGEDYSRPLGVLRTALATATADLADNLVTGGWQLAVRSRVDQTLRPVVRGWVDNEWDIQRRRGREATNRTQWTL